MSVWHIEEPRLRHFEREQPMSISGEVRQSFAAKVAAQDDWPQAARDPPCGREADLLAGRQALCTRQTATLSLRG
jgi:hypothetical protein